MSHSGNKHLFGPVPSRRLGRSLGIDLVPHKVCTLDCTYCECGATTVRTLERKPWVSTAEVLDELTTWLAGGETADYLTFSGSGEPTLHQDLGRIARWLVARTDIPLALLTNGTLFADPALRAEVLPCSLILPSLDAADDETYQRINRPHPGLTAADQIDGLVALRDEFAGQIWLEVLIIEEVNDSDASLEALARAVERICPDRIQINTAVRPGTEPDVGPATDKTLARAIAAFGPRAEPVARFACSVQDLVQGDSAAASERLLEVVRRRPETVEALAASLGFDIRVCRKAVALLEDKGLVRAEHREGEAYVVAVDRS